MRTAWVLLLAALLAGCSRQSAAPPERPQPVVEVAAARRGHLTRWITLTGHLRALRRGEVNARISGRVSRVGVREGDRVARGEPVVWLDDEELRAEVARAEAALAEARARLSQARLAVEMAGTEVDVEVQRARQALLRAEAETARARAEYEDARHDRRRKSDLFAQDAVPRVSLEQARLREEVARQNLDAARSQQQAAGESLRLAQAQAARLKVRRAEEEAARASLARAEAALAAARLRLAESALVSPIAGVVVRRAVEPGQSVGPQGSRPLLEIVDNSVLELVAPAEEDYAAMLRPRQEVEVKSPMAGEASFPGRITEVIPASDPATHSVQVRIRLENPSGRLMDGAYAVARLALRKYQGVVVPRPAVQRGVKEAYVMVVEQGVVARRPVRVAFEDETHAVVEAGLEGTERVVAVGAEGLHPGQKVRVKEQGS